MGGNKGNVHYYKMLKYTLISIWYSHTWVAIKVRTLLYNGNIYTHIYLVFTYMGGNKGHVYYYKMLKYKLISIWYSHTWVAIKVRTLL